MQFFNKCWGIDYDTLKDSLCNNKTEKTTHSSINYLKVRTQLFLKLKKDDYSNRHISLVILPRME